MTAVRTSKTLTLHEALSVRRRLRYHYSIPRTSSRKLQGPWATLPSSYSSGATGWSGSATRIVTHAGTYSVMVSDELEALDGTTLADGRTLSLSPFTTRTGWSYYTPEVRPSPGVCAGCAGQSNSIGPDTDLTGLPGTWPPADTAARLFKFTSSFVALAEPVNGAGGTHYVSWADAIARASGFSGNVAIVPAPPVNGSTSAQWQRGQTNYTNLITRLMLCCEAYGYEPSALLWYQGEANASSLALKNVFAAESLQFFTDIRQDLCAFTLPIARFRLHSEPPASGFDYWADIRALQVADPADPYTYIVDYDGGTAAEVLYDGIHRTTENQKALGEVAAALHIANGYGP